MQKQAASEGLIEIKRAQSRYKLAWNRAECNLNARTVTNRYLHQIRLAQCENYPQPGNQATSHIRK